jgi:acylphosphatase
MTGKEWIVSGRVQGVGFRAFVREVAEELGLQGEVFNIGDGTVGVIASHDSPASLENFRMALEKGPGRVASVTERPTERMPEEPGFRVTATRVIF